MSNILSHYNLTIAATSQTLALPRNVASVSIRAATGNAGSAFVMVDSSPSNSTEGTNLSAGESITIDLTNNLAAIQMSGGSLTADLFLRSISYIGTAADILYVDVVTWV